VPLEPPGDSGFDPPAAELEAAALELVPALELDALVLEVEELEHPAPATIAIMASPAAAAIVRARLRVNMYVLTFRDELSGRCPRRHRRG
jgi:hypothetical protein